MTKREEPRILLLDIETFPILGYAWTAYDANLIKIIKPTVICCWTAQWLGGKSITRSLRSYPGYKPGSRDDKALCRDLWKLLDEADEVVGHNEQSFDVKKTNYRFMVHGFKPYAPFTMFDTLRQYKGLASADQHKLAHLLPLHGFGDKLDSGGAPLWFGCEAGDPKAWARMEKYNRNDTRRLTPLYLMLRAWAKPRLNFGLYRNDQCCPKCGSADVEARGYARTVRATYQRFQCKACGGWGRSPQSIRGRQKPLANVR